jgi:DNA-directed RNA polymerase specialized sigma24 family protein
MSSDSSVTEWLGRLKAGEREAAQQLWQRYFERLVHLARDRLRAARRRVRDEEDVALSALDTFCRAAIAGRFPNLRDRDGLWPLLVTITIRKASKVVRHERRQKQGGGRVRGESALLPADQAQGAPAWGEVLGREPSPAFAHEVAEECERLLSRLEDLELRLVAVWKMEGFTNKEIAAKLGCVATTVERKLRLIRSIWGDERPQ